MEWACSTSGERREFHVGVLVDRPDTKRQHGRPRSGWDDNIKMSFKEIGWKIIN
jgi:hypothetical protein